MGDTQHNAIIGVLAGLATSDIDTGIEWLSKVLGQEPSARPMETLADWHLGSAGTIQLVLDPERAGGSMLTLQVADIEGLSKRLANSGIDLAYDAKSSQNLIFGILQDPDGNSITFVQAKDGLDLQG